MLQKYILYSSESESEEEYDITTLDINYEESEKYCEIIKNWIRKVEDIEEDPFSDYYGLDIEGNNVIFIHILIK